MNCRSSEIAIGALGATAFWSVFVLFGHDFASLKDLAAPAATVFAAITAGWIAYHLGQSQIRVARTQAEIAERNWKTSNERIVLDLFDKRLSLFEDIRLIVGEVARNGTAPTIYFFVTARQLTAYRTFLASRSSSI